MSDIEFGDNVRVTATPLTEELGYAGRVGQCSGFTTPSVTEIEVIGGTDRNLAFNVHFEDEGVEDAWFSPDLVAFVDHAPGTDITVGDSHFVRGTDGTWIPVDDPPD